ncbi:MAG: winged helix-turn-helix transcriptional regulator [Candidatus Aegiribacteria sp.]|nr:winged helix-turn-helix transcriptional regulator [Candidatus Aegiribacteria sp.]
MSDNAGTALFGKVRRNLLSLFLLNPEESYYFREIARLINAGHGAVHRELANLVEAGIITCSRVGNQTRYQVNTNSNIN